MYAAVFMMETIQVDVILSSLKELQEEKQRNEKILAEEYAKRKQLETELETATAKQKAALEKNSKMKEVMKVAEMRVAQTQAQVKMFEQVNDERKQKIEQLKTQIEEQEHKREAQLTKFRSQMDKLTDQFRVAWHDYGDHRLEVALDECRAVRNNLSSEATTRQTSLSELSEHLDQIKSTVNDSQEEEGPGGVPTAIWKTVIGMFEAENNAMKAELERSKRTTELEELKRQHAELTKQLGELDMKVVNITNTNHEE